MKRTQWLIVFTALAIGVGCGDDDVMTPDSGMGDAGRDSGTVDGGSDAGSDGGGMDDGGTDAGMDDGGMDDGGTDAGMEDGGTDAGMMMIPDGIADVRTATVGAQSPALEVRGVTVTYVRAAVGSDPAGFFVQAEMMGPALFVTADAGLDPVVAVGDVLDFDVTETAELTGVLHVSMATNFMRSATGTSVSGLVQNLSSAADVVSAVSDYVSELVTADVTITSYSTASGAGHDAYGINTAAIMDNTGLQLRVDETLVASLGLGGDVAVGCQLTVGPSPLWRYMDGATDRAQFMGYDAADISVTDCPALQVTGATAVDPTTVSVTFSRPVSGAEASDFTFTGGLTVASIDVSADGLTVTVTLGSAMMMDTMYTVTVAGVADAADMDAIDEAADEATFTGIGACPIATGLVINEVDYDNMGADGAEYIELFNASASAIDLTGYEIILFNNGDSAYRTIDLSGAGSLAAGAYLVVARADFTVPGGVTLVAFPGTSDQIQNGNNDAIALVDGSDALVDALLYEGNTDTYNVTIGGATVNLVSGSRVPAATADSNSMDGSLQRVPNACSSGNDATDWAFGPLSVGAAN